MKIQATRSKERGGVLVATIIISMVIGITLIAFLTLSQFHYKMVHRSLAWNSALPVAEAGLEEALAHLNSVGQDGDREVNGWSKITVNGVTKYRMERSLAGNRYVVDIADGTAPNIVATGYYKTPGNHVEVSRSIEAGSVYMGGLFKGLIAKEGIELVGNIFMDSFDSGDPAYNTNGRYDPSKRKDNGFVGAVNGSILGGGGLIHGSAGTGPNGTVTGTVGDDAWFAGGNSGIQPGHYQNDLNLSFPDVTLPFTTGMTPSGGTLTTETYTYSTNSVTTSFYPPIVFGGVTTNLSIINTATFPNPNPGNVTTNTGTQTTVSWPGTGVGTIVTNTTSFSKVRPQPAAGTYLGPLTTHPPGNNPKYSYNRIDSYTFNSETYSYEKETYTYALRTVATNTVTQTYAVILGDGDYVTSSLNLSGQQKMIVNGNARLVITDDFKMSGQSQITILPGASLEVYLDGDAQLSGNGVQNQNNNALYYKIFGTPNVKNVAISGNAEFTGILYAPQAFFKLGGGGNNAYDFVGAAITASAKLNGHFNFHYDELLGRQGGKGLYKLTSWNEL